MIVRQTINDTLHEALDVDGLRGLLERIETGSVRVHTVDTTEPSVLAHEILTVEAVRLPRRRGVPEPPHERGAPPPRACRSTSRRSAGSTPTRSRAVHAEITPHPETGDDLHDLLCSLVTMTPPARVDRPVGAARRQRPRSLRQPRRPQAVVRDRDARRRAASRRRRRRRDHDGRARAPRARRHHDRRRRSARATGLDRGRVEFALDGARRARASRSRVSYHDADARSAVGVAPAARAHALVLAEVPAQRCRARDEPGLHAVPAALAAPRARHPARAASKGSRRSSAGCRVGKRRRPRGNPSCSRAGSATTNPPTLDRLCHEGEIGWLRLSPRPRDVDAPAGAPNKATPISVVFRDDLGWLLDAARDGARVRASRRSAAPPR